MKSVKSMHSNAQAQSNKNNSMEHGVLTKWKMCIFLWITFEQYLFNKCFVNAFKLEVCFYDFLWNKKKMRIL